MGLRDQIDLPIGITILAGGHPCEEGMNLGIPPTVIHPKSPLQPSVPR